MKAPHHQHRSLRIGGRRHGTGRTNRDAARRGGTAHHRRALPLTSHGARSASTSGRVLVLGLDMGDGGLIRHWVRQRRLPNFAALQSAGASLTLESTARVLHTSTWPTLATGTLPGRHGVYYPYQPKPGHQLARYIEPDRTAPTRSGSWPALANGRPSCTTCRRRFLKPAFVVARFSTGARGPGTAPRAQAAGAPRTDLSHDSAPTRSGSRPSDWGWVFPITSRSVCRAVSGTRRLPHAGCSRTTTGTLAVVGFCETHPAGHYLWPRRRRLAGHGRRFPVRAAVSRVRRGRRGVGRAALKRTLRHDGHRGQRRRRASKSMRVASAAAPAVASRIHGVERRRRRSCRGRHPLAVAGRPGSSADPRIGKAARDGEPALASARSAGRAGCRRAASTGRARARLRCPPISRAASAST